MGATASIARPAPVVAARLALAARHATARSMVRSAVFLATLLFAAPAFAQDASTPASAPTEPDAMEPIIVTAGTDPLIAAILAEAETYRRKVVLQQCTLTNRQIDLKGKKPDETSHEVQRLALDDAGQARWTLLELQENGKPVSEQDFAKRARRVAEQDLAVDDEQGYAIMAEVLREPIERLGEDNGYVVYRLKRLPKRIRDGLPGGLADKLQPVIWVADADGKPWVRRMHVGFDKHRFFLIASASDVVATVDFQRLEDDTLVLGGFEVSGKGAAFGRRVGFEGRQVCTDFSSVQPRTVDPKVKRR